jgi:predicted RNA binding protein YcfA (HicA-like mRNA interferase family)
MSKREKLRNNPRDADMQELETLLLRFNFVLERITGSHHIYRYTEEKRIIKVVVPLHGRKVKAVYVKRAVQLLDDLFPVDEDENSDEEETDE